MLHLNALKPEARIPAPCPTSRRDTLFAQGFAAHFDDPSVIARAHALAHTFTHSVKFIYPHDRIAGSMRGLFLSPVSDAEQHYAKRILDNYGDRSFITNADHYAPDYETFLRDGIPGTLNRIHASMEVHKHDPKKLDFLKATEITMSAFGELIRQYGDAASEASAQTEEDALKTELLETARCCYHLAEKAPETFRQALQLVWLCYIAFRIENRYAMAFGRMDQFLWPFYQSDLALGRITPEEATDLLGCALFKIVEMDREDVCNIAIGGVLRDGSGGVNELSYCILEAVKRCAVPGPNLSARLYKDVPEEFLDACLKVIGTGIGYPALMNDEVNIPAMVRFGYSLEDSRDYCMVGCIENFMAGKQPPWSDGRYNSPKYLELTLCDGRCLQTGLQMGPHTGEAESITSMEDFMSRLHLQLKAGAAEYMALFRNNNDRFNREQYQTPFLSCFCQDCIGRGLDINNGGAVYPSAHGAGCMGIGTMADSLAAIEQVVFTDHSVSLSQLRDALAADFTGYEDLQQKLLAVPKYGNNHPLPDKYAVWYVEEHARLFDAYRTPDGGGVYIGIAANVQNISAGREVAATADGRKNGIALSDAASPMRGMDKNGPTAVILSTSKPDYTLVGLGTVLNQKYSPIMFSDPEKRAMLRSMIRVYFNQGGQEIQINSVSRDILKDAIDHPENYQSLVVRVSGFSAFYNHLDRTVKEDILQRTEQG